MPYLEGLSIDPQVLLSRPLSWLEFVRCVLELARDVDRPLGERVRFLSLAAENLDGFFMKRLDNIRREVERGAPSRPPWPAVTAAELATTTVMAQDLTTAYEQLWNNDLWQKLTEAGLRVVTYSDLDEEARRRLATAFEERLLPILTPLAVDPGRPFPYISQLSLSLAVLLEDESGAEVFARVKAPTGQQRWIELPDRRVIALEAVIAAHVHRLFPGLTVRGCYPFRLTRSVDIASDEEHTADLHDFAQVLARGRRFAPVVRLEVARDMPVATRSMMAEELGLPSESFIECDGPLALVDLARLPGLDRLPGGKPPAAGRRHPNLPADDGPDALFAAIAERDIVLHHPHHDYRQTVAAFVRAAAQDPAVRAIKQSLYRTSAESDTLDALIGAAEAGKEVVVLLELQARLDEAANIAWAERLHAAGVMVSYGFIGYKTHTRVTLVVREEEGRLVNYVHFGTGDYNVATAASYTDVSLLSSRPELGKDLVQFFNFLTGAGYGGGYQLLTLAPQAMREELVRLIDQQAERHRTHRDGRIVAMLNSLADLPICAALCRASQAGVPIDLIVRRECGLRPGVAATANIRIRRVLGSFLEHQRVFSFGSGRSQRIYLSSADWLQRNLERRIEAMLPVVDPAARRQLSDMLDLYLADTAAAWLLDSSGNWTRLRPTSGQAAVSAQLELGQRLARQRRRRRRDPRPE